MIDFNQPQAVKAVTGGEALAVEVQARDMRGLPLAGLLRAINHVLRQQSWARDRLVAHRGKAIRLGIDSSFPLAMFAPNLMTRIGDDGLLQAQGAGAQPHADVSLWLKPSLDAVFAGVSAGPAGLSSHLRVEGDVLLAGIVGELAQHLRWDFEEDLSRVVGDAGAHRAVHGAQDIGARLKDTRNRLETSAVQWLTVESPYLVDRASWIEFSAQLAELSKTVERLSAKFPDPLSNPRPGSFSDPRSGPIS